MVRILIIDDDVAVAQLLREHLSNEGYEVTVTHMAEDGFAAALETSPDLIMLDVNMPDATGFQLCARFRENPVTKSARIIMMTGAARWPNQQAIGRQMGADEYILKPFDVFHVGDRVHCLLGSKRPTQSAPAQAALEPVQPIEPPIEKIVSPDMDLPLMDLPLMDLPQMDIPIMDTQIEEPKPGVSHDAEPVSMDSQRFFDFSVDAVILATHLPKTRAGRHIADQLLRCGTSVGARITESQPAESEEERLRAMRAALKDLRESGYWLMLIREAKLLDVPSLPVLETTCHELITILAEALTTADTNSPLRI